MLMSDPPLPPSVNLPMHIRRLTKESADMSEGDEVGDTADSLMNSRTFNNEAVKFHQD